MDGFDRPAPAKWDYLDYLGALLYHPDALVATLLNRNQHHSKGKEFLCILS
jgi:hypothetical protein